MTIKDALLMVNDRTGQEDVISNAAQTVAVTTTLEDIPSNKTHYFCSTEVESPPIQTPAVRRSLASNNNNNSAEVPVSRASGLASVRQQRNYHLITRKPAVAADFSAPPPSSGRKLVTSCQRNIKMTTADQAKFAHVAVRQFDTDSYEKQRKSTAQQPQATNHVVKEDLDAPSNIATGSSSPTSTTRIEFMRSFLALSRRLKELNERNEANLEANAEDVQAMREFVSIHVIELIDKLKTSTSYELKEEILVYISDFVESATVAQQRAIVKSNKDLYDSLCDCMNVFMRRRNSFEQGLSATIDIFKMCAVQGW